MFLDEEKFLILMRFNLASFIFNSFGAHLQKFCSFQDYENNLGFLLEALCHVSHLSGSDFCVRGVCEGGPAAVTLALSHFRGSRVRDQALHLERSVFGFSVLSSGLSLL